MSKYNADTVSVETHSVGYGGERFPAINVKSYWSWKDSDIETARSDSGVDAGFNAEWVRAFELRRSGQESETWWEIARDNAFEYGVEDARALFGDNVKVSREGRSGGWFTVRVDPESKFATLKGTSVECSLHENGDRVSFNAGFHERWALLKWLAKSATEGLAADYLTLVALNVYEREEATRKVVFAQGFEGARTWDTFELDVPNRVQGDERVAFAMGRAPVDVNMRHVAFYVVISDGVA